MSHTSFAPLERQSECEPLQNSRDVKKAVLVLVLLVDTAHEGCGRWQNLIDEDEDSLLGRQLDALSDHVDELPNCQIGGDEVLLLVDGGDIGLLNLFADDLYDCSISHLVLPARTRERRLLEEAKSRCGAKAGIGR